MSSPKPVALRSLESCSQSRIGASHFEESRSLCLVTVTMTLGGGLRHCSAAGHSRTGFPCTCIRLEPWTAHLVHSREAPGPPGKGLFCFFFLSFSPLALLSRQPYTFLCRCPQAPGPYDFSRCVSVLFSVSAPLNSSSAVFTCSPWFSLLSLHSGL